MYKSFLILGFAATLSFSQIATQTNWSDGDGVPGPVINWKTNYYTSTDVDSAGGVLKLANVLLPSPVSYTVDDAFSHSVSVTAADVDGDGDVDVLGAAANYLNALSWWENKNGTGTSWIMHQVDDTCNGIQSISTADIDNDGDIDVLGAAYDDGDIAWWENTDGSGLVWAKQVIDNNFVGAHSVYATDLDGDGDIDVMGMATNDDDAVWWENDDGTGTSWTKHVLNDDFNGAVSIYASDLDGDGDMDILGAAAYFYDITWWENPGESSTSWTEHIIEDYFHFVNFVYAADVNGDGNTDVLGAGLGADELAWWENTDGSATSWTKHIVTGGFDNANSIHAVDLDDDGDIDVLGTSFTDDEIAWWENLDGSGTVWTKHTLNSNFDGARSVFAADLNGNGQLEVLGAALWDSDILWWDIMSYKTEGVLESSILDVGALDTWDNLSSSFEDPSNTEIGFLFRSSSDAKNMGTWSDTVFSSSSSLSGILANSTRYLQYRVILTSSDQNYSPVLEDITFSYTIQTGVESSAFCWSLHPSENPSYGHFSASVTVPESGMVKLSLFDLSGRMVSESSNELQQGIHSIQFNGLSEGVYFCVMNADGYSTTVRIAVL